MSMAASCPVWRGRRPVAASSGKLLLYLLERLALRFGQHAHEVDEACGAYCGINPERAVAAERAVEQREGVGKRGAARPQRKGACAHGNSPDAARKQFGYQHPCHGAESHGVAGYGRHHQCNHQHALYLEIIACAQHQIYYCQSACAYKHKLAAAEALDGEYGYDGEYHVDDARYDDVEQHVAERIACRLEYLLGVVEYHVGAAPLLEHSHHDAYYDYPDERTAEQRAQSVLLVVGLCCGRYGPQLLVGIAFAAYACKYVALHGV